MSINELIIAALHIIIKAMMVIVPLLLSVAYLTLAERRIIGFMQLRQGPNVTGPFGMLQPIADAIKLLVKEPILPDKADKFLFLLAPAITFTLALAGWAVMPIGNFVIADVNLGLMYPLASSSLGVYGIIIAGWASSSRYAFLGSIRSASQMISYELTIGVCILCIGIAYGTLNLKEIVAAQQFSPLHLQLLLIPVFIVFFISILAETNRHPFDMPEAESELVAGYHVEYSSLLFALFFLGEYANMILMSALTTTLFMGGWLPPFNIPYLSPSPIWFILKVMLCLFIFIWVRAALPRYRYDQLMDLGWKRLLPFSFFWMIVIATTVFVNR